jgi:hypothetical protein
LDADRFRVILDNILKLMKTASTKPGGANFGIATENLNELFAQGTPPSEYNLSPNSYRFLLQKVYELTGGQDPEPIVKSFTSPKFTIRDARHIEDCMLYHVVATRAAGEGDDLTRVRRLFDWTVRHVTLVPAESLAPGGGIRQAQVRPADVLLRGMATEAGNWSERGWVFMALCRQIGIDVGFLTYTPRASMLATSPTPANRPPVVWICAAVVDGKPYLFDQRIGLEIPSPDGSGVATLDEAITDPIVLGRLDLPGLSNYGTTAADLASSPSKIGVIIDSSVGYYSPRMRLLQGHLRGEYRTTLFRDPADQALNFVKALGPRMGNITLWDLPVRIEEALFTNPEFVAATQMPLRFFEGKYPLLYARTKQLHGEIPEALDKYGRLRFAENAVMDDDAKTPIGPETQRGLDVYATYFLAQSQADQGNTTQAEGLYRQMLALTPEPGAGRYFYYMLRWGAISNLARLLEARGDFAEAIALYASVGRTPQRHGDLLRARNLALAHPLDEPVMPPMPAPEPPPPANPPTVAPKAEAIPGPR